jgi:hypothetical protein
MDTRYKRVARSAALTRDLNESIAAWAESQRALPAETVQFYCECGDLQCFERVALTRDQYKAVRTDSMRFAVLPEYVNREVERVVEEHGDYVVVKKAEELRSIVEDVGHPRRPDAS